MRKYSRFVTLLLALMLLMSLAVTAYAEGHVTYYDNAGKFVFTPGGKESPSDLFGNFKDIMPGDTRTDTIRIINHEANGSMVKVYLRSRGAQAGSDAFLSQLNLAVRQKGSSLLYVAPANETAQLTDWVYLGTIYATGEITLELTLDVPITMGNEFQNQAGYIDWEFKVEELPTDYSGYGDPKTGDNGDLYRNTAIMAVSLSALMLLLLAKKRRKQEETA